MRGWVRKHGVVLVCSLVGTGCYSGAGNAADTDAGADGSASSDGSGGGDDANGGDTPAVGSSPGIRLLTQREFRNSVRDLLGVELELDSIPREQLVDGHGHISAGQGAGLQDVEVYYELGLRAAERAVSELDFGCDLADSACASETAQDFLLRAFREPPPAQLRDHYLSLLESPEAGTDAVARFETFIASVLSSPYFLYRRELGDEPVDGEAGARWLTDHEIATRLSFLVWQSVPDRALLEAAQAGELRDAQTRLLHLERMLDDPRARIGQLGFVFDWLGATGRGRIDDKDPEVLEGTSLDLEAIADESLALTVADILFDAEGRFAALLSTDRYHVDAELASLLGTEPVDVGFESRALDPATRRGVLMHPTILAAHTKESGASPFPIGEFVYENLLCETIGAPAEIPPFDPAPVEGSTLREQLEELTEPVACQGCHAKIGPPGFAFMTFDPIGRYRAADGLGRPYDTSGTIPVGMDMVGFEDAPELAAALAEHEQVARCVARRLFRWTYGYFEDEADVAYVETLEDEAVSGRTRMRELLAAIVGSDAFARVRLGE